VRALTLESRVAALDLPATLRRILEPVCTQLTHLTTALRGLDREMATRAAADPVAQWLMTAPGDGPIVAFEFPGGARRPGAIWRRCVPGRGVCRARPP
jgi:transposase